MTSGQHVSFSINEFLELSNKEFTGLLRNIDNQIRTWDEEYEHLQHVFKTLGKDGQVIFEYAIPSFSLIPDVIVLLEGKIFVIEYKGGDSATDYKCEYLKQVRDYASRLKYFHSTSNEKWIIPILVCMNAPSESLTLIKYDEISLSETMKCNRDNLIEAIQFVCNEIPYSGSNKWETDWSLGIYKATPTIIKAACKVWESNNVNGLNFGESDRETRLDAEDFIMQIVHNSYEQKKKSIVFVTGVPGAGKTLVGLGLSVRCQNFGASMLSGNGPLVRVLSTALRRDLDKQYKEHRLTKEVAERYDNAKKRTLKERNKELDSISVDAIIREAYAYKREIIESRLSWEDRSYKLRTGAHPGTQHVIIFDEAQRAWTREKMLSPGMSGKKDWQDKEAWPFSEPGLFLWDMNQREWGVFVCLVGGGQEINTGEAGIAEWMRALTTNHDLCDWQVFVSDQLLDPEYQQRNSEGKSLKDYCDQLKMEGRLSTDIECNKLHLTESQRSIRNKNVSDFVNKLLSCDKDEAKRLMNEIKPTYKIFLTRDIRKAKEKLREMKSCGMYPEETRMGMLMSSEAARLRPLGYDIKKVNDYLSKTPSWFLDDSNNVRSSDFLEIALNEFFVQGLEVDYSVVMWDGDFRYNSSLNDWDYYCFDGKTQWRSKKQSTQEIKRFYMKNAYRVLLTRARLGMVVMIPQGDLCDATRSPEVYDSTYEYLREIGLIVIDDD